MYYGSHWNPWRHGRLKVGAVLVLARWIRNLRGRSCQGDRAARPSSYVELMCHRALEINQLGGLAQMWLEYPEHVTWDGQVIYETYQPNANFSGDAGLQCAGSGCLSCACFTVGCRK